MLIHIHSIGGKLLHSLDGLSKDSTVAEVKDAYHKKESYLSKSRYAFKSEKSKL